MAEDAGRPEASASPVCVRGARETKIPAACNGDEALCGKRFDRVVFPMTHNAMSNADEKWVLPNQTHGIARQLADGIRGMMLDTHYLDVERGRSARERSPDLPAVEQAYLCHGECAFGRTRLLEGLCAITNFLDAHPGEVFSIIFENGITDADTDAVMKASGLTDYVYTHTAGAPWPTLSEMIASGKRVVVFTENEGGDPPYLHPAWSRIWDTPYSFEKQSDFTCALNRGDKSNPLFLINHWLGRPGADVALAREVNVSAVLGARVDECTSSAGRPPTFVGVDFYEVGDLFSVVKAANDKITP
jgi:hypothetical protein